MNKIGEILKSTRERRNLTLSQAAGKIKVREEYLEKIENDEVLENDVFTIGYLRLYSKYLRVNIEGMIDELKTGISEIVEESVEEITENFEGKKQTAFNKRKVFLVVALTVVSIFTALLLLSKGDVEADLKKNDAELKEVTKESAKTKVKEDSGAKANHGIHVVTKVSDSQFEVKNINQESNSINVVALDSTMVTFLDTSGTMIKEVFMNLGEKIPFPKGYKDILVKTRIPLAIEVQNGKTQDLAS